MAYRCSVLQISLFLSLKLRTMPATEIRAVVFDMDGLMFNTEEIFHATGTELVRRRGKTITQEVFNAMMGRQAHDAFQAMIDLMELDDSIPVLQEESDAIFMSLLDGMLAPMPGLFELLDAIESRGLPKAVATSSGRNYMTQLLERFDLHDRFVHTLTAEDITNGKPHPEIYLTAAKALDVDPQHMMVLEDSENGTRAAAAAGAHIISVPHAASAHHDFSVAKAVATSLHDDVIHHLIRPTEGE